MIKLLFFLLICSSLLLPQEIIKTGLLMGRVVDAENKQPLPGVNIYISDLNIGTSTDIDGKYSIKELLVGSHSVKYSFIGYESFTAVDVIIRSDRITYQDAELFSTSIGLDSVIVTDGYFSNLDNKPVSTIEYSAEEIRRAPGSAGDISRILFGLPSIAKTNDGKNSLIVRGGSPVENSFYVDNIEINNINHFATQGSSDGLFGILNIDFVKNVVFNAGGFSSIYGDRLSSVMEITLREGNRNEYDAQANLNFGGISGQYEGPINGNKGSFMISANKSFLDLLMNTFAKGYPAPEYVDVHTKVVYDLSDKHKLSFIDIYANDIYNVSYDKAFENEFNRFGSTKYLTNTAGLNWLFLWDHSGYSNTSVSSTIKKQEVYLNQTKSSDRFLSNNTTENLISLRNINYFKLNENHKFDFGLEVKADINNFNYTFFQYRDEYGNIQSSSTTTGKLNTIRGSGFATYHLSPIYNFTISLGGRIEYFDYTDKVLFSPRNSITYKIDPLTSISASAGIYYQNLPALILAQSNEFKKLSTPKAFHYVLSLNRMITEETRLTLEVYFKEYSDLPVDPSQPKDFLFDQVVTTGMFTGHSNLIDNGKALSKGVEIILQKKLAKDYYGMISASYSLAKYKDLNGVWRNRIYDSRFNFNIEGGYKPDNEWEFSLRFIYAAGAPYTPFDEMLSKQFNKGIIDLSRINNSRLPDYHSLNLRVDRRFYFNTTNLVVFLSIWNVYNRDNVSAYVWNEVKNEIEREIGWNTIPVFGVEYEF
ncbi:MAG: TonB-dependent receptor [Ignavibacteriales bacterium]|nr:MAG: TonB-dependent receptor [Ignavibacteriales bacterium]